MRILVIDDSATHQAAAIAQLKDHETTVVGTYDDGEDLVIKKHEFDVVLVDLLMPASGQSMGEGRHLAGKEMPVGIFLALLAAKNGAKYVAVFTDSDHHSHPASACFDAFNRKGGENNPTPFRVEGAKVILSNTRNWVEAFYREDLSKVMDWEEYYKDEEKSKQITIRAKNWRALLDYLLA